MLLLPIAALALMAFFFVLLLMTVAGACEARERRRVRSQVSAQNRGANLGHLRTHERMLYGVSASAMNENARLVWATQVPLLERLESSWGVPPDSLRSGYNAMARSYPALYEGRRFEEWLEFVENARVVCYQQGRLQLAAHGYVLLEQCRNTCGHGPKG